MSDNRTADSQSPRTSVPLSALLLGYAGLIPFLAPPILVIIAGPTSIFSLKMLEAVQTYGAIILSFMGAIHWGFEVADNPNRPSLNTLSASVSPALFAFFCLQMDSSQHSLWLLAGGFVVLWAYDFSRRKMSRAMPSWYISLRTPLTLGAVTGLIVSSFV